MSFFSSIFNGNEIDWSENILDSPDQFKQLVEKSYKQPSINFLSILLAVVLVYTYLKILFPYKC